MTEAAAKPFIPGWGWPVIVVGLLALNIGVCAVTVVYAMSSTPSVEPGYYEKALSWDEQKAEFADPQALGWVVDAALTGGMIDISIHDAHGGPVVATAARGVCFHHAHADERIELEFIRVGDGRFMAQAGLARPGLWEVRVEIMTEETKTRVVRQLDIAAGG